MKKIIFLLFVAWGIISGQSSQSTGLSILKNGVGSRIIAMGELGVAQTDIYDFVYNPSLLSLDKSTSFSFTHNTRFNDIGTQYFLSKLNLWGIPVGLTFASTSIDDIEIRTRPGEADATFNANYFYGGVSFSGKIYSSFFAGATVKFVYENLYTDDASGLAYDLGFSYSGFADNLLVGLSIRNLGKMNNLRYEASDLPSEVRIGASYKLFFNNINILFSAGTQKYFYGDNLHLHGGFEIDYSNTLFLRAGYMSGYYSKTLSAGFGVKWKNINLDYAFQPYQYNLGDSHSFSISYSFR
ncbi:PorV/PorQ family protein [Melioribacter sp. OK-6-Me]|uniref:PorV/PorQ family protein n=1 Tax=unclassified Melioribacter TaxID=2627329 RepID=UPI003EDADF3F